MPVRMELESLIRLTSANLTVGIGMTSGDPREKQVISRADFCDVVVYHDDERLISDLAAGNTNAAVRGSLPAGRFLQKLKTGPGVSAVRRIALLALPEGTAFLLAPVGIDEGGKLSSMRHLVSDCREFASLLGWEARIAVLSSGRAEDARRGRNIRKSLRRGERLATLPGVRHCYIAIEEALPGDNCVIAPDGVTGNLIYRTLTRLGSGSSFGALYFPLGLRLADTSRSGSVEEYVGAIALANIAAKCPAP